MALIIGAREPATTDDIEDPDRFDVHRPLGQHFSLGFGPHYCLGQALARLEARLVLEAMLERFPNWEVDWSAADFNPSGAELRGWNALPLILS